MNEQSRRNPEGRIPRAKNVLAQYKEQIVPVLGNVSTPGSHKVEPTDTSHDALRREEFANLVDLDTLRAQAARYEGKMIREEMDGGQIIIRPDSVDKEKLVVRHTQPGATNLEYGSVKYEKFDDVEKVAMSYRPGQSGEMDALQVIFGPDHHQLSSEHHPFSDFGTQVEGSFSTDSYGYVRRARIEIDPPTTKE